MPAPIPPPRGAYSPAARVGNLVFVSGQVPRNPLTGELEGSDLAAQTRRVLENLRLVLGAAGAALADVVSVTVYLADPNDWSTFNEIYESTFSAPYPSRTVVGAQLRGVLVELAAVAAVRGSGDEG